MTDHDASRCAGLLVDSVSSHADAPGRENKDQDEDAKDLMCRVDLGMLQSIISHP